MKKLLFLFIILSVTASAQLPTQQLPTQFDRFINKPEIEWAAYINDTIRFDKLKLNTLLLHRLKRNEIKASLPVGSGSLQADQIRYLKNNEVERMIGLYDTILVSDSPGDGRTVYSISHPRFDTAKYTLTDVTQVLYVEKGLLKSYIPWVAAMISVITSTGTYLGDGDLFSSCFNFNYKTIAGNRDNKYFLSRTRRNLRLDSFDVKSKLKELYGRNLVQTLWPYILQNKIRVFSPGKNRILKTAEINSGLVNEVEVPIPIFDSSGNIMKAQIAKYGDLMPEVFNKVELVQDWYYDQTRNMVFAINKELVLFAKKWTPAGEADEATPILTITF